MNLATELFWEDEKQPVAPARPHDREEKKPDDPAPAAKADDLNQRLQQVAGNAALAREAEEAKAAQQKVADAARQPAPARQPEAPTPAEHRREEARAKEPARKARPSDPRAAAERRAAERAAAAEAQRLSEETKAAAVRSAALAQVLASFENNAGKAELLVLAQLAEAAPPGIAEETARALALAVMRADPEQRGAIASRIKAELGDRHDLRLAHLVADRLAWLVIAPPPPPPPPPPPEP